MLGDLREIVRGGILAGIRHRVVHQEHLEAARLARAAPWGPEAHAQDHDGVQHRHQEEGRREPVADRRVAFALALQLIEEKGLSSWRTAGAADQTEWINQIRTISTIGSDYYIQESIHPNYWGQLALRSCVRQAYNGGTPRGGTCNIAATGLNSQGEPVMLLH